MSEQAPGRFSDRKYAIPFGRYVGSSEVEPPADEVLVGREGQRAYLIDLLISTGRRGAYLVTGRRGTGKTSFVKHCISEYEASVFSRFLRGNVGRGVWDRVLVLLFWLTLLISAVFLSEITQLVLPYVERSEPDEIQEALISPFLFTGSVCSAQQGILPELLLPSATVKPASLTERRLNTGTRRLLWVILGPLGIVLLFPCVYAKMALETILKPLPSRFAEIRSLVSKRQRSSTDNPPELPVSERQSSSTDSPPELMGMTAAMLTVAIGILSWNLNVFRSPVPGVGHFMPALCCLYLV